MKKSRLFSVFAVLLVLAMAATPAFAADPNPGTGSADVTVMNADTSSASVTAEYYNQDGSLANQRTLSLNGLGSAQFKASESGLPDNWKGSMLLSSTTEVASIATIHWTGNPSGDGIEADSYEGFTEGAAKMYMPYAVYGPNSQYTVIAIQNTGSGAADFDMKYYNRDGVLDFTIHDSIPVNGQKTYDLHVPGAKIPVWANSTWFQTKGNWSGAVLIETTGSGQGVAAVANNFWPRYSIAYRGSTAGATKVFIPAVARRLPTDGDFFNPRWLEHTIIAVQNVGDQTTNVVLKYVDGYTGAVVLTTPALSVAPNAGLSFNTRAGDSLPKETFYPLGNTWSGSVVIETSGVGGNPAQPIAAVSYSIRPRDNESGGANGVSAANGGSSTYLPEVYQIGGSGNARTLYSFMHLQNVTNAAATVTVRFMRRDGTDAGQTQTIPLAAEKGAKLNLRGATPVDLGGNFSGSAYITSDQPIAVVVDNLTALSELATYNGYSR